MQLERSAGCRKKLSQEEIADEVRALIRTGHKRLAVEAGEDPVHNPLEYILDSIKTIYSVREGGNSIRRVNVNIAATDVESYRKLKNAGIPGIASSSRKPTTGSSTNSCIPPGPRATMPGIPKRWTVPRKAAATMWASVSSSA